MRISHKVAYAVRVTTTLARLTDSDPTRVIAGHVLAETDDLPPGFLHDILRLLRNGRILQSKRGGDGDAAAASARLGDVGGCHAAAQ